MVQQEAVWQAERTEQHGTPVREKGSCFPAEFVFKLRRACCRWSNQQHHLQHSLHLVVTGYFTDDVAVV